jgi:RHS repeat-associated protein
VIQRDSANNGYNWTATYDALGRRLRTTHTPVTVNVAYPLQTLTIGSLYDPQVEFQELAVTLNPDLRNGPGAQRTWKVFGPDLDGREHQPSPGGFGSAGGVGGLEATIRESDGQTTTVINDVFGNVVGTVSGTNGLWNPARVSSYGPEPGYQALTLSASVPLVETLVWRTRRIDPTGYYWLGARYYDPVAGRMVSPDPLGHAASMSLYDLCNGDPLNRFDADGRIAKGTVAGSIRDGLDRARTTAALIALVLKGNDPTPTELGTQLRIQAAIDYNNAGGGLEGAANVANRYNPWTVAAEAFSGIRQIQGAGFGEKLTVAERAVAISETVSFGASVAPVLAAGLKMVATRFAAAGETTTALDWSIVSKTGETRVEHVIAQHGAMDLQKPIQGVFYGDPVATVNDAWAIAQKQGIQPVTVNGADIYLIRRANSGYAGGFSGQLQNLDNVTIITQQGTPRIITGFPGNGLPLPQP